MPGRNPFGKASLVSGASSIVLSLTARENEVFATLGRSYALKWFADVGAVRPSDALYPQIVPMSPFFIDDGIVVQYLFRTADAFAVVALALFIAAARHREASLYSSAGFVCACCSLFLVHKNAGLAIMLVVGIGVVVWRRARRA